MQITKYKMGKQLSLWEFTSVTQKCKCSISNSPRPLDCGNSLEHYTCGLQR